MFISNVQEPHNKRVDVNQPVVKKPLISYRYDCSFLNAPIDFSLFQDKHIFIRMKTNKYMKTNKARIIPQILYGTAWKEDATETLVTTAIKIGFRGIDTANQKRHYH